jgi:sulfopyruvate decarboxylase subunit alpha
MNAVHSQSLKPETTPLYAKEFLAALEAANVELVGALPESHLKSIYLSVQASPNIDYILVSNESELPGLVAGAYLGGKRALMIMENSGLRQACEPITRLAFAHHMPLVMVVSYRGDLGEANWWGHNHAQVMAPLLDALRIPYHVASKVNELRGVIDRAFVHADASQWPVCLVMTGECVEGGRSEEN